MTADPYKYFRVEAHELLEGLTQGTLALEKGATDQAMVGRLLRLAHTLKGASRVVKQPVLADLAHGVEDILSPFRDTRANVPKDVAQPVLQLLDQIETGLAALDQPFSSGVPAAAAPPSGPASVPASEEALRSVRVDVEELEGVLSSLSEAAVRLTRIQRECEALDASRRLAGQLVQQLEFSGRSLETVRLGRVKLLAEELENSIGRVARSLGPGIDEVQSELSLTREGAIRLRLLPSRTIFPSNQRAVRDAAITLGKEAELETCGGDIRLDADVLLTVRDAALQLVRNAVAHGLESPPARAAAGK